MKIIESKTTWIKSYTNFFYRNYVATVYEKDLVLNNPEGLIWHKTQTNQTT